MTRKIWCWILVFSLAFQPLIYEATCHAQETTAAAPTDADGAAVQTGDATSQFEEAYKQLMETMESTNPSWWQKGILFLSGKKKKVEEQIKKANEELKKAKEDMTKMRGELLAGKTSVDAAALQSKQAVVQSQLEAAAKIKAEVAGAMRKVGETLVKLSETIKTVAKVIGTVGLALMFIPPVGGALKTVAAFMGKVGLVVGVAGNALIGFSQKAEISAQDFMDTVTKAKEAWKTDTTPGKDSTPGSGGGPKIDGTTADIPNPRGRDQQVIPDRVEAPRDPEPSPLPSRGIPVSGVAAPNVPKHKSLRDSDEGGMDGKPPESPKPSQTAKPRSAPSPGKFPAITISTGPLKLPDPKEMERRWQEQNKQLLADAKMQVTNALSLANSAMKDAKGTLGLQLGGEVAMKEAAEEVFRKANDLDRLAKTPLALPDAIKKAQTDLNTAVQRLNAVRNLHIEHKGNIIDGTIVAAKGAVAAGKVATNILSVLPGGAAVGSVLSGVYAGVEKVGDEKTWKDGKLKGAALTVAAAVTTWGAQRVAQGIGGKLGGKISDAQLSELAAKTTEIAVEVALTQVKDLALKCAQENRKPTRNDIKSLVGGAVIQASGKAAAYFTSFGGGSNEAIRAAIEGVINSVTDEIAATVEASNKK